MEEWYVTIVSCVWRGILVLPLAKLHGGTRMPTFGGYWEFKFSFYKQAYGFYRIARLIIGNTREPCSCPY